MEERHTDLASDDVVYETIQQGVQNLAQSQTDEGYWAECFDTGVMPDAQTAICLYLLGVTDIEWIEGLLTRIEQTQRLDGTWSVHPEGAGDLSTTVECYYALTIYDRWSAYSPKRARAKAFIKQKGGLRRCRNLTKMFLAIGGEIPWSWLPSAKIYAWMFARFTPVAIEDIVTFTRLHVAPVLVLSSLRYIADTVQTPYLSEFLPKWTRLHLSRSRVANRCSRLPSRSQRRWMERCKRLLLRECEDDGTAAGYHSSTFLILFVWRAFGTPVESEQIQRPIAAIRANLYREADSEFVHQQTCNGHIWNTSLALGVLRVAGERSGLKHYDKGIRYLLSKQQLWTENETTYVGWGFSSNNTHHPDVDDTLSVLDVLYPARKKYPVQWSAGIQWLLSRQNQDGGWSAFEKDSNKQWVEWLPANDMKHAMVDPSTPDMTSRVIEFLTRNKVMTREDDRMKRAVSWLIKRQRRDGSWFGRWGSTYLYGTWCAVKALEATGFSSEHPAVRRAEEWLIDIQLEDGSFGESCESDVFNRFTPLANGMPTQTAWGLDTLLYLWSMEVSPIKRARLRNHAQRAAQWLLCHAEDGHWLEHVPNGSAFPGALYIRYHIYPKVWPVVALSHYLQVTERG